MSDKQKHLDILNEKVVICKACRLADTRTKTVFGEGNPDSKVVFVGEGPGASENETGRPFVGRAGKLLDNMIVSMGLKREDVYILNIVKCRPPGNRKPKWDEIDACGKHLTKQLSVIYPDVIIALGNTALEGLTGHGGITQRCGKCELLCVECSDSPKICKLIPCYHPSALLRNPKWKDAAWHALQTATSLLKEAV